MGGLLGSGIPYLNTFLGVQVPLRTHYEIKVYTFFSLVTSKSSSGFGEGSDFGKAQVQG